jgi:hypothetical protein
MLGAEAETWVIRPPVQLKAAMWAIQDDAASAF